MATATARGRAIGTDAGSGSDLLFGYGVECGTSRAVGYLYGSSTVRAEVVALAGQLGGADTPFARGWMVGLSSTLSRNEVEPAEVTG